MNRIVREVARSMWGAHRARRYHSGHRLEAMRYLRNIENEKGSLDSKIKSLCDQYASDVFGSRIYSPWLYVYSAIRGTFVEGWIPDNFYGKVVIPKVKGRYGDLSALNGISGIIFNGNHFPDLLSLINGKFYFPDGRSAHHSAVRKTLFDDNETVVLKLDGTSQGRGIHFFTRGAFDIDMVSRMGDGVFQAFIKQDPSLAEFSPSAAVSTLRVTTVIDERSLPDVRSSYLRFGVGSDTHVQSKSHVRVPVSIETGKLNAIGYTTRWTQISNHPDSSKAFGKTIYPNFKQVCEIVKDLHAQLPCVGCIGWDVCVDNCGVVNIIEWNGVHNDIKFSEATQGPCFKDLGWEYLV